MAERDLWRDPFPGVHRVGALYWQTGEGIFWFRVFGRGLHFNSRPPLFSERNGYTKFVRVGKWRIRWLGR